MPLPLPYPHKDRGLETKQEAAAHSREAIRSSGKRFAEPRRGYLGEREIRAQETPPP